LIDVETADDSQLGLQNALAAHGTNLTDAFNAFATKMMTGATGRSRIDSCAIALA